MINYILQVMLFQILFLAAYDLFLNKETFFKWNRLYLIATPLLSLLIPVLRFDLFKNALAQEYIVLLPEVMLNPQLVLEQTIDSVSIYMYINVLFYIGVFVFLLLFLVKLTRIIRIISSHSIVKKKNFNLVLLKDQQSAFSFFNYIFIAKDLVDRKELQVIEHELVHCRQHHTVDLLFFEVFKILMWFNPLVYIYQKRITLLHEYISDAEVVKETDKKTYFNRLLSETFGVENISFVNQFYKQSLIKKRISMITKSKSQKMKQLKYLVLIPLLGGMLLYSSCETNEIEPNLVNSEQLYLIDGKEVSLVEVNNLDSDKIASMNVWKGNEAIKEYGEKGRNGVIQITLKKEQLIKEIPVDYSKRENVPFAIVEEVPVFPGCEGTKKERKECLRAGIQNFVKENFNADLAKNLELSQGRKKIYVQFQILKTGKINIIGARAPHAELEKEAKRVVGSLPEMTPGKHLGKSVNVTYMLPIAFEVE